MPATNYPLVNNGDVSPTFSLTAQQSQIVVTGVCPGTIGACVIVEREISTAPGTFAAVGSIKTGSNEFLNELGAANYRLRLSAYGVTAPSTVNCEIAI